jgi:hypothetical protein
LQILLEALIQEPIELILVLDAKLCDILQRNPVQLATYNFDRSLCLPVAILAAGGEGAMSAAELYDPTSSTWTATGAMTTDRSAFKMVVLLDGKGGK